MNSFFKPLSQQQLADMPILSVAHVGDGVYELLARTHVAQTCAKSAEKMHRETVRLVSAEAQAEAARHLFPILSEDEVSCFMRGRNAHPKTVPKRITGGDYLYATALEALFGMLHLTGRQARISELWQQVVKGEPASESE